MILPRILVNDQFITNEQKCSFDASTFRSKITVRFLFKNYAMDTNQNLERGELYSLKLLTNGSVSILGEYELNTVREIIEGHVKFKKYIFISK